MSSLRPISCQSVTQLENLDSFSSFWCLIFLLRVLCIHSIALFLWLVSKETENFRVFFYTSTNDTKYAASWRDLCLETQKVLLVLWCLYFPSLYSLQSWFQIFAIIRYHCNQLEFGWASFVFRVILSSWPDFLKFCWFKSTLLPNMLIIILVKNVTHEATV